MNVLDLRGPQFLQFYLLSLGCAIADAVVLRRLLRGPGPETRLTHITLAPLEIAYLSGGEKGAVDAAIAGLVRRGHLIADGGTRRISSGGPSSPSATLLERMLCKLTERSSRKIDDLRALARPAAEPFSGRLQEHELILSRGQKLRVRLVPPLLLLALLALGIAKVQVGVDRNKRRQAELVQSLKVAARAPGGFDPQQIQRASDSLLTKRRRELQKAWPVIHEVLGERFGDLFIAYAAEFPFAPRESTLTEGQRFARWILDHADLSLSARNQISRAAKARRLERFANWSRRMLGLLGR